MAYNNENGRVYHAEHRTLPIGHIAMAGRADVADCLYGQADITVKDVEDAAVKATEHMLEHEASQYRRIAVQAFQEATI